MLSLFDFPLFGVDITDPNTPVLKMNDNALAKLLSTKVGVTRSMYSIEQALEAAEHPVTQLGNYSGELGAISARLVPILKSDAAKLIEMGYTTKEAEEFALEKASAAFLRDKQIVDLAYPLMNDTGFLVSAAAGVDLRSKAPKAKKAKKAKVPKIKA